MTTRELGGLLGGGVIFLLLLVIAVWVYVAYTKLDNIEHRLKKSSYIQNNRRVLGEGIVGRIMRLTYLGGILMWPSIYNKKGVVSKEEIENLPLKLKLWVIIPDGLAVSLVMALTLLWSWGTYKGWVN